MPGVVVDAMAAAAAESVSMVELQAGASRYIAAVTGAEAGYVTAGASSALTLGAAAIMAGLSPAAMDRLPDTTGLRSEFIIAREHRNGYDHAARVAGASLVEVGMNEVVANAGVRRTEALGVRGGDNRSDRGHLLRAGPAERAPTCPRSSRWPADMASPCSSTRRENCRPRRTCERSSGPEPTSLPSRAARRSVAPQSSGILCGRRDLIASVAPPAPGHGRVLRDLGSSPRPDPEE